MVNRQSDKPVVPVKLGKPPMATQWREGASEERN